MKFYSFVLIGLFLGFPEQSFSQIENYLSIIEHKYQAQIEEDSITWEGGSFYDSKYQGGLIDFSFEVGYTVQHFYIFLSERGKGTEILWIHDVVRIPRKIGDYPSFVICDKKEKRRLDLFALYSKSEGEKYTTVWKANLELWKIEEVHEKVLSCCDLK